MKKVILFLTYCLVFVNSRPERTNNEADVENVEIEKQRVIELKPYSKTEKPQIDENKEDEGKTKEILAKIDLVNKNLGYVQNKNKPQNKLYYGFFSKSTTNQEKKPVATIDLIQSGLKGIAKITGPEIDTNTDDPSSISKSELTPISKLRRLENIIPSYFLIPHISPDLNVKVEPKGRKYNVPHYILLPVAQRLQNYDAFAENQNERTSSSEKEVEKIHQTINQVKNILSNVQGHQQPIIKDGNKFIIPSFVPTVPSDKNTQEVRSIGKLGPANSPMVIIPIGENPEKLEDKPKSYIDTTLTPDYSNADDQYEYEEVEARKIPNSKLKQFEDIRDPGRRHINKNNPSDSSKLLGFNLRPHQGNSPLNANNSTKDVHNQIGGDKKKVWSRDNTGSGIFIQRLKVRRGGVAIAGPGGIATAGSGGTAIVGPSGVAYTQPDSVAIAGAGSKVVAVDAGINLTDLVHVLQSMNRTGKNDFLGRVGKVVATGPVIYYNRG